LLLYVGFPEFEIKLLQGAAKELGVLESCKFIAEMGSKDKAGDIIDATAIYNKLPSVIFLNLDSKVEHWKKSLAALKDHSKLKVIPVVGLGRISDSEVSELYDMNINSYIKKPDTFEEMVRIAGISLNFWLEISHVPVIYLTDT